MASVLKREGCSYLHHMMYGILCVCVCVCVMTILSCHAIEVMPIEEVYAHIQ